MFQLPERNENPTIQELIQEHIVILREVKQLRRDVKTGIMTASNEEHKSDMMHYCEMKIATQYAILTLLKSVPVELELKALPAVKAEYEQLNRRF